MSGPAASVLIPRKIDAVCERAVRACIADVAGWAGHDDFMIEGRPFLLRLGEEDEGELLGYAPLAARYGWRDLDVIRVVAMCNDDQDHALLGRLVLRIARLTGGMIAFDSLLRCYTDDRALIRSVEECPTGEESIFGIESFERWLAHPDFRMVK